MTESTCFTADTSTASFERGVGTNESKYHDQSYYNHHPISSRSEQLRRETPKYLEVIPNQCNLFHPFDQSQFRDSFHTDRDGYEVPIQRSPSAQPRATVSIYDKPNIVTIEIKADVIASLNEHDSKSEKSSCNQEEGNLSPPPTYSQVFSDNFPNESNNNFEHSNHDSDGHFHHSQHPLTCHSSSSSTGSMPLEQEHQQPLNHSFECDGTKMHDNPNYDDELGENDQAEDDEGSDVTGVFLNFLLIGRLLPMKTFLYYTFE